MNEQKPDSAIFITVYSDKDIDVYQQFYFLINMTEEDKDIDNMNFEVINHIADGSIIREENIFNHIYNKLSKRIDFKEIEKYYLYIRYFSYTYNKYLYANSFILINENGNFKIV